MMLIHIDPDAVRTRVHRKLLVQAMPEMEVRCLHRLEMSALEGIAPPKSIVVFVCLEDVTEPALGSWLSAARSMHPGLRWLAMCSGDAVAPDWLKGLDADAVLRLPLDVHAIKDHLRAAAK
jgi:hypothetical protein